MTEDFSSVQLAAWYSPSGYEVEVQYEASSGGELIFLACQSGHWKDAYILLPMIPDASYSNTL